MLNHKGLATDHMRQFLSQPSVTTNQFLIEDVSQVAKKNNKNSPDQRQVK